MSIYPKSTGPWIARPYMHDLHECLHTSASKRYIFGYAFCAFEYIKWIYMSLDFVDQADQDHFSFCLFLSFSFFFLPLRLPFSLCFVHSFYFSRTFSVSFSLSFSITFSIFFFSFSIFSLSSFSHFISLSIFHFPIAVLFFLSSYP